jgi:hypothetical protein
LLKIFRDLERTQRTIDLVSLLRPRHQTLTPAAPAKQRFQRTISTCLEFVLLQPSTKRQQQNTTQLPNLVTRQQIDRIYGLHRLVRRAFFTIFTTTVLHHHLLFSSQIVNSA